MMAVMPLEGDAAITRWDDDRWGWASTVAFIDSEVQSCIEDIDGRLIVWRELIVIQSPC